jgi:hypothetical protein
LNGETFPVLRASRLSPSQVENPELIESFEQALARALMAIAIDAIIAKAVR